MISPRCSPIFSFAALCLALLAFAPELKAGASNKNGNPFSQNGTFFNNSGTYTAIMRGQNLMGVSQFSIFADGLYPSSGWNMLNGSSSNSIQPGQTNPGSGAPGFVSLYYNGSSYNGPAFSVVDPGGNQIGSVFYTYKAGGQQWDPGQTNPVVTTTNVLTTNYVYSTNVAFSNNVTTNILATNQYITNIVYTNLVTSTNLVATNSSLTTNVVQSNVVTTNNFNSTNVVNTNLITTNSILITNVVQSNVVTTNQSYSYITNTYTNLNYYSNDGVITTLTFIITNNFGQATPVTVTNTNNGTLYFIGTNGDSAPLINLASVPTNSSNTWYYYYAYTNATNIYNTNIYYITNITSTNSYQTNSIALTNVTTTNQLATNIVYLTNVLSTNQLVTNVVYITNTVTNGSLVYTNTYQTNYNTNSLAVTNVITNAVVVSTNIVTTNTSPYGLNGGYNYYDGYWNANLQNKYPNQVFYGNGAVSLGQSGDPSNPSPINQANGTANVRQIPFSVQGTRVSGSTSQIY